MGFSCGTLDRNTPPVVVWATGEIDLAVAARLGAEIEQHLVPGAAVALDCAGVTFMDSTGVQILAHALRTADQVKGVFLLVTVPESVRQVLDLCGLSSAFTIVDNLAQAEAEVAERQRGPMHQQ